LHANIWQPLQTQFTNERKLGRRVVDSGKPVPCIKDAFGCKLQSFAKKYNFLSLLLGFQKRKTITGNELITPSFATMLLDPIILFHMTVGHKSPPFSDRS